MKDIKSLLSKVMENLEIYVPGEQPQDVDQWIAFPNENAFEPPMSSFKIFAQCPQLRLYLTPNANSPESNGKDYSLRNTDLLPAKHFIGAGWIHEILDIIFKAFANPAILLYHSPSMDVGSLAKTYLAVSN